MGPYCQYCGQRCFLSRVVPDSPVTILATCASGMANDREKSGGHDHRTTLNPVTGTIDIVVTLQTRTTHRVCEHPRCVRAAEHGRAAEQIPAGEQFVHVTFLTDGHAVPQRLHPECLTDLHQLTTAVATTEPGTANPVPQLKVRMRRNTLAGKRCRHERCETPIDQGETYAILTVPGKGAAGMHLECAGVHTGLTADQLQALTV